VIEQPKPTSRLVHLQILRAIAAALVVWAHSIDVALLGKSQPLLASGNLENFGAFGVDIFFVISGFIISTSASQANRTWLQFARDRFLRVAPIYYLLSLPWIARAVASSNFSWAPFVPNFIFWPIVDDRFVEPFLSVGWTLSFEALFYCAMTGSIALRKWIHRPSVAIVMFFGSAFCARQILGTAVLNFLGNPIILEFLFGIFVGWMFRLSGPNKRLAILIAGCVALALGYQYVHGFGDVSESQYIEDGELSFTRAIIWGLPASGIVYVALLTESQSTSVGPIRRFLAKLGDASYSTYLVHLLVMSVFKALQSRGFVSGDCLIVSSLVCSQGAGSLSFQFVERPLLNIFKRRSIVRTSLPGCKKQGSSVS
jgi:exopolysaccharide production protein ExoZ